MNICANCKHCTKVKRYYTKTLLPFEMLLSQCSAYEKESSQQCPLTGEVASTTFKVKEVETDSPIKLVYGGEEDHPYCKDVNKYGLCYKFERYEYTPTKYERFTDRYWKFILGIILLLTIITMIIFSYAK